MREMITVRLPAKVKAEMEEVARGEFSFPQMLTQAAEEYVFIRRFRLLRDRMIPKAQAQGIRTDEDVYQRVS